MDRTGLDFILRFAEENGWSIQHMETSEDAFEPPTATVRLIQTYRTREPVPDIPTQDSVKEASEELQLLKKREDRWKTLDD